MLPHSDVALEVKSLSKIYSRSEDITRNRLAKVLFNVFFCKSPSFRGKLQEGEFWSLKNINFTLRKGEALGVIGLNGAGKTTLLRVLAGQILPDEGEVCLSGISSAMIDLTAGFQMNASGSRNIFLRGAMLGLDEKRVMSAYDEIVEFSELAEAIEAPVLTYSSGMLMRLAFSIMMVVKPDVFFIDEILSVGDFRFRQKCLSKIRELRAHCAFVLVSHSMSDVVSFCDRAILLDKGEVVLNGKPKDVVSVYEEMRFCDTSKARCKPLDILQPLFHNRDLITDIKHYWCDCDGFPIEQASSGDDLHLKVFFKINYNPRSLVIGVPVWTEEGVFVTAFSTEAQSGRFDVYTQKENVFLLTVPSNNFNPGTYISILGIADGPEFLCRIESPPLKIVQDQAPRWGIVSFPHSWKKVSDS